MKCRECSNDFPEPDIIDGTAYFVCESCGNVHEIAKYRIYTLDERVSIFENKYGVKLPDNFIRYAGNNGSWVVKLPPPDTETKKYYFSDGFYSIGTIAGLDPNFFPSIFDSESLISEWGLPKKLVLLEGDGHTWLALDYRDSTTEPTVIVIESDECTHLLVANNFNEFVNVLLPYESVFDSDGNVIFNRQVT